MTRLFKVSGALAALAFIAFIAFRPGVIVASLLGIPIAFFVGLVCETWRVQRSVQHHEVRGEKWDTCGRCGTLQDHCTCLDEVTRC